MGNPEETGQDTQEGGAVPPARDADAGTAAQPQGMVNDAQPEGMVNDAQPHGMVNDARPEGMVNDAEQEGDEGGC